MAAFSTAVALISKEITGFAAVVNGINLPLMLLAGVLLPVSLGPGWMNVLAHFNPLYYLVQASRTLAVNSFSGDTLWQAFAVLTPLTIVSLAWATRVYRRAVA
jgi:ABC-2 type transport system permease protein